MSFNNVHSSVSPWQNPDAWDSITINGQRWPPANFTFADPAPNDDNRRSGATAAKLDVKGAERGYRWDIKEGAGLQGAIETYRGRSVPPFSVTFYIWSDDMYQAFIAFLSGLFYPANFQGASNFGGGQAVAKLAYNIYHPKLANLSIYQVICEGIGSIDQVSDDLMFTCTIKFREFYPALPVPAQTPDKAATPADDLLKDNQIKSNQTQITELSGVAFGNGAPNSLPH